MESAGRGSAAMGEKFTRRRALALGASGLAGGLAGCSFGPGTGDPERATLTPVAVRDSSPFELTGLDYPREVELREPVEYALTVRNTDPTNTHRFATTVHTVATPDQDVTNGIVASIGPEETHTFQLIDPHFAYLGRRDLRINAFDHSFTIRGVAMTLPVGEIAFEEDILPDHLKINVCDLMLPDGSTPEGKAWAFASVTLWNGGRVNTLVSPPPAEFTLVTADSRYDPSAPPEAAVPPTLDGEQYAVVELKPQTTTTGWLAFAVPDLPEAPRVRWEHAYEDGIVAAEWTVQSATHR